MKTIEELKGMTQEDLVCLVQELNEKVCDLEKKLKDSENSRTYWCSKHTEAEDHVKKLKDLSKQLIDIL